MTSKVYFADLMSRSSRENKITKIKKLLDAYGLIHLTKKDDLVAVKVHFGEEGNDSYINPVFIRQIVDEINKNDAKPFLTDTNTLYYGNRHDSVEHIATAILHGFDYAVVGAPLIIADGLRGEDFKNIEIDEKHFKMVKIAAAIEDADSMIVASHFKGHGMSGFGGAIKNLAMGCSAYPGKLEQHGCVKPLLIGNCTGCGTCVDSCPLNAVSIINQVSEIDYDVCIGCNACMDVCPESAMDFNWDQMPFFIEKMVEYAYGAVKNKNGRVGYINFLTNITPDCDCVSWSDMPIVPDVGIVASQDPVAIDAASYDLVNEQIGFKHSLLNRNYGKGEDKFRGVWEEVDGRIQIIYGEEIGLGSADYELVTI